MIFVFGSNLAGRHGRGAALYAKTYHGAEYGIGEGPTGTAYALPTKGLRMERLSLTTIEGAVRRFYGYARARLDQTFLLTPVGCGLAGNDASQIAAILKQASPPSNVVLSLTWLDYVGASPG